MLHLRSAIVAAALFGVQTANAQDPYVSAGPVDVVILTDWAHFFSEGSSTTNRSVPTQSAEQQLRNLSKLMPAASETASRSVIETFVAPLKDMDPQLGLLAQKIVDTRVSGSDYGRAMAKAGFNPEDLSDVIAAYTLAAYRMAHNGTSDLWAVDVEERKAVGRATRNTLIAYLPGSITEVDLRAVLEQTRAEHLLLTHVLKLTAKLPEDERIEVIGDLLVRSEDFALVDVRVSRLDKIKGFVER